MKNFLFNELMNYRKQTDGKCFDFDLYIRTSSNRFIISKSCH